MSKLGEEFAQYMSDWDEFVENEDKIRKINLILEDNNFVMFFVFNGDVFGCSEPNRVVFARLKNPDDDATSDWMDDASFMANNITKTLLGHPAQQMFKLKNIDDIEVIPNKNQAYELLLYQSSVLPEAPEIKSVIQLIKKR